MEGKERKLWLPIAEEVVREGEKQIDRRKRKKVTQLEIRCNSSEGSNKTFRHVETL